MIKYLILILNLASLQAQFNVFVPTFDEGTGNGLELNQLAYYKFEEATGNALNAANGSYPLVEVGTIPSGTGVVANDRIYDGTGANYFSLATDPAFAFPFNKGTITTWASFGSRALDPNDQTIVSRGDFNGTGNFSYLLALDHSTPNDSIFFFYSTDGNFDFNNNIRFEFDGEAGTGFYFIALTWDGATLKLSATHISETTLAAPVIKAFSGPLYIGISELRVGLLDGSALHNMHGDIDELGFWNTDLTDCQLQWLWTQKAGTFTQGSFDTLNCANP